MRIRTILAAAAAPAALAAALLGTAAPAAHAATIQQGGWQLAAFGGSSYQAAVQQPINADGSSIFSAKSRTIPVKWKVTKSQSFKFESLQGAQYGNPDGTPYASNNGSYSALSYTPPAGTTFNQLTSLQADAAFTGGTSNHGGSLRWSITVPGVQYQGQPASVFVYYGTGPNFTDSLVQSGNLIATSDQRVDTSQIPGGSQYDTWSHAVSLLQGQAVKDVSLVLDGGWGGDQLVNLSDATVTTTAGSSTFTWPPASTAVDPSTVPMYVYLAKVSGDAPAVPVDETLVNTQGDSGGQYRVADGMYMYNFPVSNLPDPTAKYQIGISTNNDGSSPVGVVNAVQFGTK